MPFWNSNRIFYRPSNGWEMCLARLDAPDCRSIQSRPTITQLNLIWSLCPLNIEILFINCGTYQLDCVECQNFIFRSQMDRVRAQFKSMRGEKYISAMLTNSSRNWKIWASIKFAESKSEKRRILSVGAFSNLSSLWVRCCNRRPSYSKM